MDGRSRPGYLGDPIPSIFFPTSMPHWYENDDLWTSVAGLLFNESVWDAAPPETDHALLLLDLKPGAAVLDLCCGPGRHSLELARRGFRVTGVDRTRTYLEAARARAVEAGVEAEFVEADMRAFSRENAFDGAINLFTSFGYFEDPEDDLRVLRNLYRSLRPGCAVVCEMVGKENLARTFQPRDWREHNGEFWLYERTVRNAWSWMENRWVHLKDGARKEYRVTHRLYSATEITGLARAAGFDRVEVYGNLEGAPYDHEATRLVMVAHKPPPAP